MGCEETKETNEHIIIKSKIRNPHYSKKKDRYRSRSPNQNYISFKNQSPVLSKELSKVSSQNNLATLSPKEKQNKNKNKKIIEDDEEEKVSEKENNENEKEKEIFNENFNEKEYDEINELVEQRRNKIKKDTMICYKENVEIKGEYTLIKESVTILTKKQDKRIYRSSFKFKSPSLDKKSIISYSVKMNNNDFKNCELDSNEHFYFVLVLTYNLEADEDPLITFEITSKIKTIIYLTLTSFKLDFSFPLSLFSINIKSPNDFYFHCLSHDPLNQNKFNKKSSQEISLKGKDMEKNMFFIFKTKNSHIDLDKSDKAFYCYDETEMSNLDKAINNIRLAFKEKCIFSYKDIYDIKGKTCFVKSYITFAYLKNEEDVNDLFYHRLPESKDLELISLKIDDEELPQKNLDQCNVIDDTLILCFDIPAHENYHTLEVEYSFSIRPVSEGDSHCTILIDSKGLYIGGYYQLFINVDTEYYYKYFYLIRKNGYKKDDNGVSVQMFYEPLKDKKRFNVFHLKLYKKYA